jgi:hypothetical protein
MEIHEVEIEIEPLSGNGVGPHEVTPQKFS